jgi:hypothetical protein
MNENELGRKLARHLSQGLTDMDSGTLSALQAARKQALAKYAQPKTVFGLVLATHGKLGHGPGHRSGFRYIAWVPVVALVVGLLTMNYWQTMQQQNETAEVDAHLLAADLPIHAYLDPEFDQWLENSSQQ